MSIKRMTLVTETWCPEVNGVTNTLLHWVKGLIQRGVEIQIIRPRQSQEQAEELGLSESVLVPGLPIPGYGRLRFGLPTFGRVKKAIQLFQPDVIYVATEGPLGYCAVKQAKSNNIPVLSGFHTNFHQYFAHYRMSFLTPWVYRYLRYLHNLSGATLVPTQQQKHYLHQAGFRRVQVISRGVDAQLFSPQKRCCQLRDSWGLKPDDLAVIYVGRLAAEKNLDLAVQTFIQMRSEECRLRFILVGEGPQFAKLKERHPEFIFSGLKKGEELARHYASADIFLFPSKTDTFGNVVLEAMASGLAVVAFNYAAAGNVIEHEESGLVIPMRSHHRDNKYLEEDAFIGQAQNLVDRPNLLKHIRHNARLCAETLVWDQIVDQFYQYLNAQTQERHNHAASKNSLSVS